MRRPALSTVVRYLRTLAPRLGLTDWHFEVEYLEMPSNWARVVASPGKSLASMEVSPSLFRESAAEQRQTFVHELLHVHLFPMEWSFESAARELGLRARRVAVEVWAQRSEKACDDLARLLAPGLPLPPWCS